jgi:hypothetical protein
MSKTTKEELGAIQQTDNVQNKNGRFERKKATYPVKFSLIYPAALNTTKYV